MAIFLPERTVTATRDLTPREIVTELDKYVVGQAKAKRAVAIALRNRIRRQRLPADIADEVTPKNILMIGPTGVGKTEIARRLARLAQSPFIKVEASKFTEVGYVGRDVESMVRDLVELAVEMVRSERSEEIREKAGQAAEERLLDLLLPPSHPPMPGEDPTALRDNRTRERMREQLREGRLDDRQDVALHALTADVGSLAPFAAGDLVDLVDEDDARLLHPVDRGARDRLHVDQLLFLFLRQRRERIRHAQPPLLHASLEQAGQHVLDVDIDFLDRRPGDDLE